MKNQQREKESHGSFGGALSTKSSLETGGWKEKEALPTNEVWRESVDSKAESPLVMKEIWVVQELETDAAQLTSHLSSQENLSGDIRNNWDWSLVIHLQNYFFSSTFPKR